MGLCWGMALLILEMTMFDSELFLERLKAYGQSDATYSLVDDGNFVYVQRISPDGYWFGSVN